MNKRISKKIRDKVFRLYKVRADLGWLEVVEMLGYSEQQFLRDTRRIVRHWNRHPRNARTRRTRIKERACSTC